MTRADLARLRLANQMLLPNPPLSPREVIAHFGAVQSQDYHGAKWGVAQRIDPSLRPDDQEMDRLFNEGRIVRTHILRPTWHFVLPEDLVWIQKLTAHRVHAANASYYRKHWVEENELKSMGEKVAGYLEEGGPMTRNELGERLAQDGVDATGMRLAYVTMYAELECLICSGPLQGKQFTYRLVSDVAPKGTNIEGDEALAELLRRYFRSHGPASVHDASWWSGLTVTEIRRGIEILGGELEVIECEGKELYHAADLIPPSGRPYSFHLLPNFDEHIVAYRDHEPSFDPRLPDGFRSIDPSGFASHMIVRDGLVIGGWRRSTGIRSVTITPTFVVPPGTKEKRAFDTAVSAYSSFLGKEVVVEEE